MFKIKRDDALNIDRRTSVRIQCELRIIVPANMLHGAHVVTTAANIHFELRHHVWHILTLLNVPAELRVCCNANYGGDHQFLAAATITISTLHRS